MLFPLQATLPPGAAAWKVKPTVSFMWRLLASGFNIPFSANLLSTSCGVPSDGKTYCALVGNMTSAPALFQSDDGGLTWATVNIAGMPSRGGLTSVSCGTNRNGISTCAAIGVDDSTNVPFVVQTTDSGQTWTKLSSINFTSSSRLNNVNCTLNSDNTLCQITGTSGSSPVVYYYTTAEQGWQTKDFSLTLSPYSSTNAISCASLPLPSSKIGCLVSVTHDLSGVNLVKTEYASESYTASVVNSSITRNTDVQINAVGCTNNAGTIFCTAAGRLSNSAFLLQNSDLSADNTWRESTFNAPSAPSEFVATCCSSLNGQAICNAAGHASSSPLLISTINSGTSWIFPVINLAATLGNYTSSSCSISEGAPLITVSGTNTETHIPTIVYLTNALGTWFRSSTLPTLFLLS